MKAGPLISETIPSDKHFETGTESVPALREITLRQPPLSRSPLSVVYKGWDNKHRCHVIVKA